MVKDILEFNALNLLDRVRFVRPCFVGKKVSTRFNVRVDSL